VAESPWSSGARIGHQEPSHGIDRFAIEYEADPARCALRARNAVKPRETVRGVESVSPGQSTFCLAMGAGALRSQRRGHGFKSRHLHNETLLHTWTSWPLIWRPRCPAAAHRCSAASTRTESASRSRRRFTRHSSPVFATTCIGGPENAGRRSIVARMPRWSNGPAAYDATRWMTYPMAS